MRLRYLALPMLLAIATPVRAEHGVAVCDARNDPGGPEDRWYYSGLNSITYSGPEDRDRQLRQLAQDFLAYLAGRGIGVRPGRLVERIGAHCNIWVDEANARGNLTRRLGELGQEASEATGWTPAGVSNADRLARPAARSEPASTPVQRRRAPPASTAGARPGLYIGMPNETASQETDAQRAAAQREVAAENARQLARARAAEAERQQAQAAYQARLAENERQQAAHRAQLAENERRQAAYRQARAEWEARVARCQAGDRNACVAQVTPQ